MLDLLLAGFGMSSFHILVVPQVFYWAFFVSLLWGFGFVSGFGWSFFFFFP